MKGKRKTKDQLVKELEEMRRQLMDLEICGAEFRDAQKKYETVLESAPDALVFVNREGKIVLVNAQLEKLFGYSPEELVGNDLTMLIPTRFRDRHHENLKEYFLHPRLRGMGTGLKIYGLKKDGAEFPADISLSTIETNGELLATAAIRDISELRRTEEQIERNYHIQRVISSVLKISLEQVSLDEQLDKVLDLIITIPGLSIQSRGAIYLVEDESERLVLKAPRVFPQSEQIPCRELPFGKCLCGQAAASCTMVFTDCIDERHEISYRGESPHGHYCVPIVSGEKVLGLINVFVREGHRRTEQEGEFLAAVANTLAGVIERRRSDLEKQRLQEQLAEAEKLSALGRISANVADEIRNPLTSVGGFARRLDKLLPEGTKGKEYAGFITSEVMRLETILRDVISLTRSRSLRPEDCDIREIIDGELRKYEKVCRERSVIVRRSYGDVPRIGVDKGQVSEAIGHLLSNAIDAMPGGGTLTLLTDREISRGRSYVAVKVQDTGVGIPEERLGMIFEPFFTTKVSPKGTGLGLAITKKLVESHAGFIQAQSTAGSGSNFSIYFPYDS